MRSQEHLHSLDYLIAKRLGQVWIWNDGVLWLVEKQIPFYKQKFSVILWNVCCTFVFESYGRNPGSWWFIQTSLHCYLDILQNSNRSRCKRQIHMLATVDITQPRTQINGEKLLNAFWRNIESDSFVNGYINEAYNILKGNEDWFYSRNQKLCNISRSPVA